MSKYFNEGLIRVLKLFNLGIRFKPLRCLKFVMPPNPHGKEGGGWRKKKPKHFLINMSLFSERGAGAGEERRANSGVTAHEVPRHDAAGSDSSLLSRRSGSPIWQISGVCCQPAESVFSQTGRRVFLLSGCVTERLQVGSAGKGKTQAKSLWSKEDSVLEKK